MNTLFLMLFLSLAGNNPADDGIPYRLLVWSDYKAPAPDNEPTVAARTITQLAMERANTDGVYTYTVKAYFLPYSSFVRVRTNDVLRHEQTHFKIAQIMALRCMRDLKPLQRGDSVASNLAEEIYNRYTDQSSARNDLFDIETNHSLNKEAEQTWELRITEELTKLEIAAKEANGRSRK